MSYWPAFIYRVLKDRCWPDRLYRSDQVSSVDECWWNYSVPWCPCCTGQVLHTDDCSRITVYFSCCSGQVLSAGRLVLKDVICRGAVVWVGYSPSSKVLDKLCSFHAGCWQWIFFSFFLSLLQDNEIDLKLLTKSLSPMDDLIEVIVFLSPLNLF